MTYAEFILNIISTRGQWGIPKGQYFEAHHIVPVCMGGKPSREESNSRTKYLKHPNIIRLYAKEHFIAHKLLYEENPDNFGLYSAWVATTAHYTISAEEYEEIKCYAHSFPEHILSELPNEPFHYKLRKEHARKTNRDTTKYVEYQEYKRKNGICETRGENNGMYGKGYLVSGGRNGHASIRYFYKDFTFESRKELLEYLHSIDVVITASAIRLFVHKEGTLRLYNMYKDVFDNLRWEYKE